MTHCHSLQFVVPVAVTRCITCLSLLNDIIIMMMIIIIMIIMMMIIVIIIIIIIIIVIIIIMIIIIRPLRRYLPNSNRLSHK